MPRRKKQEDPRAELVRRLMEYEKFKNAAQMLYQREMIENAAWSNPGEVDDGRGGTRAGAECHAVRSCCSHFEKSSSGLNSGPSMRSRPGRVFGRADDGVLVREDCLSARGAVCADGRAAAKSHRVAV